MKVFVTGGTGFLGGAIIRALIDRGAQVVVVSRNSASARAALPPEVEVVEGDPTEAGAWQAALRGCDGVINLAGAPLDGKRWNAHYRQVLRDSRVDTTRQVVEAIAGLEPAARPVVLVSASGIDYYPFAMDLDAIGGDADEPVTEEAPPGDSALARICRDWEAEALRARELGVRVVLMRTAVVFGAREGALPRLELPFKLFAGGRIGSGEQWFTWIHVDDVARAYLFALDRSDVDGPVNLCAPEPVRNRDLARALGRALSRPAWIPAPAFAVKAAVGEFAEYILHGRRAVPTRLQQLGFRFEHPALDEALRDLT